MKTKKERIFKGLKRITNLRETLRIVKVEIVSSKKQTFQMVLKNLDYSKDTSEFHKFIATLKKILCK
jgi:hypothetical protein